MDVFLKEILEPSEQDTFDHLTRMETPSINTFRSPCTEYALPSVNMGLPGHLIQCHRPQPAYTTHTAPVVKMLVEQDERRKAASNHPAETEPNRRPQEAEAGFEEETQVLSKLNGGITTPGTGKDSVGMSTPESSLPSPSVCNRVIFARKPPLRVLRCSSLAHSSKK
ncbi:CMT1A duplicated region transcript 4 protein homolog [Gavia stellata]|uniref:CMT1A duplicated region transcript 4 protein homolog n=1 Tax=Gavia stellata TaxID=37040 RepID=UPI00289B7DA3|nr:CMT1A duplicated region transcript 4 protein homolog [Gavia stellata]